jgi:hypothetical protein
MSCESLAELKRGRHVQAQQSLLNPGSFKYSGVFP